MEMLWDKHSDECGCREQEWVILNVNVILHLEPDGSGEAFLDCGEWEDEWHFDNCPDLDVLREKVATRLKEQAYNNETL